MPHLPVSGIFITREARYPEDVHANVMFEQVHVETRCPHVFRRFELAARAKCETIYVQDDDAMIDVWRLWSHHQAHPEQLTHAITPGHRKIYEDAPVTLIGWGCFFPRAMAERFVAEQATWRREFGDEIFEAEADRFFTYAHRPWQTIVMPIRQLARTVRMCERPGHYQTRDQIIKKLKERA